MTFKNTFIFLLVSMYCYPQINLQKELNNSYERFKKEIPNKLLDNFPEFIIDKYTFIDINYPESMKHNQNYCGVFIKHTLPDSSFSAEYSKNIENNTYVGIIKKNQIIQLKSVKQENGLPNIVNILHKDSLFIVPDFHSRPLTDDSLSDKVETLIIDTELGKFLPEEYYIDDNSLPKEIKHGYSKGIYFDKKTLKVIYWLIIW